jgi:hypothetical protein
MGGLGVTYGNDNMIAHTFPTRLAGSKAGLPPSISALN